MSKAKKMLAVTLVRSLAKKTPKQIANASGLGLRKMHQTVKVIDTPETRGMINRIAFLVKVEEAS